MKRCSPARGTRINCSCLPQWRICPEWSPASCCNWSSKRLRDFFALTKTPDKVHSLLMRNNEQWERVAMQSTAVENGSKSSWRSSRPTRCKFSSSGGSPLHPALASCAAVNGSTSPLMSGARKLGRKLWSLPKSPKAFSVNVLSLQINGLYSTDEVYWTGS